MADIRPGTLVAHDPDCLREGEEHGLQRLCAASRDGQHPGQVADTDTIRRNEQDPPLTARNTGRPGCSARSANQITKTLDVRCCAESLAHQREGASTLTNKAPPVGVESAY